MKLRSEFGSLVRAKENDPAAVARLAILTQSADTRYRQLYRAEYRLAVDDHLRAASADRLVGDRSGAGLDNLDEAALDQAINAAIDSNAFFNVDEEDRSVGDAIASMVSENLSDLQPADFAELFDENPSFTEFALDYLEQAHGSGTTTPDSGASCDSSAQPMEQDPSTSAFQPAYPSSLDIGADLAAAELSGELDGSLPVPPPELQALPPSATPLFRPIEDDLCPATSSSSSVGAVQPAMVTPPRIQPQLSKSEELQYQLFSATLKSVEAKEPAWDRSITFSRLLDPAYMPARSAVYTLDSFELDTPPTSCPECNFAPTAKQESRHASILATHMHSCKGRAVFVEMMTTVASKLGDLACPMSDCRAKHDDGFAYAKYGDVALHVLQRVDTLFRYRKDGEGVHCPFLSCESSTERFQSKHSLICHIETDHNVFYSRTHYADVKAVPDYFSWCHLCRTWHLGYAAIDSHLEEHIQNGDFAGLLDGKQPFGGHFAEQFVEVPAYCPYCMSDDSLPLAKRLFPWLKYGEFAKHVGTQHVVPLVDAIKTAAEGTPCPAPSCRGQCFGAEDQGVSFFSHLAGEHGIDVLRKGKGKTGKSAAVWSGASGTTTDLIGVTAASEENAAQQAEKKALKEAAKEAQKAEKAAQKAEKKEAQKAAKEAQKAEKKEAQKAAKEAQKAAKEAQKAEKKTLKAKKNGIEVLDDATISSGSKSTISKASSAGILKPRDPSRKKNASVVKDNAVLASASTSAPTSTSSSPQPALKPPRKRALADAAREDVENKSPKRPKSGKSSG
ncbi:hypothetical protein JCM11641_007001 [Rhodosporidiobolus odoratus]